MGHLAWNAYGKTSEPYEAGLPCFRLARQCGFRLVVTLRLALSAMPETRAGAAYK